MEDLPTDAVIIGLIQQAKQLNDDNAKRPSKPKHPSVTALETPIDLLNALESNNAAHTHFNNLSPSKKKDYITWLNEAKTENTRSKRLNTAIEWIAEGKSRNWKYEKG